MAGAAGAIDVAHARAVGAADAHAAGATREGERAAERRHAIGLVEGFRLIDVAITGNIVWC